MTSGALPCVLKVSSSDGTTSLFSVATGSGTSATANTTPLTQLVVARLTGADPAALFDGFSAGKPTVVTSTALTSAQAGVVATLAATGNACDAALDALEV